MDPVKLSNFEKRKPKNPIKFAIELNEEQKLAKSLIYDNPVVLLKGQAGSGKTLAACQCALDMFFKREIEKIVITRPTVAKEDIGFLPGDLKEKMDMGPFNVADDEYHRGEAAGPFPRSGGPTEVCHRDEQAAHRLRRADPPGHVSR